MEAAHGFHADTKLRVPVHPSSKKSSESGQ